MSDPTAIALPVHFAPLPLGGAGATPWSFTPAWFALLALGLPLLLWVVLAWRRALEDDPNRLRRAGRRELQRLLSRLRRAGAARSVDLHAWCQAAAHSWGVRVAAPTEEQLSRSLERLSEDGATLRRWQALWREAEHSLYAAE